MRKGLGENLALAVDVMAPSWPWHSQEGGCHQHKPLFGELKEMGGRWHSGLGASQLSVSGGALAETKRQVQPDSCQV